MVTVTVPPADGPRGTTAVTVVGEVIWNVVATEPNVTVVAPVNPLPSSVTRPPPPVGPFAGVREVTRGDVKVNREPGTTGLVPAAVPLVVTVTPTVPPNTTSGVTTVTEVGVEARTWAAVLPKSTTGVPVPKPDPVRVTVVPPTAGPDVGPSEVTVGQPAAEPERRPRRAAARGLPQPEARS